MIWFVLGPGGVRKSDFGAWLAAERNWLHLEIDRFPARDIDRHPPSPHSRTGPESTGGGDPGGASGVRGRPVPASDRRGAHERDPIVKRPLIRSTAFVRAAKRLLRKRPDWRHTHIHIREHLLESATTLSSPQCVPRYGKLPSVADRLCVAV